MSRQEEADYRTCREVTQGSRRALETLSLLCSFEFSLVGPVSVLSVLLIFASKCCCDG